MAIEDWIDYFYDDDDQYPSYNVICKYCGRGGFSWYEFPNGWRLVDEKENIHKCESFKVVE